MTSSTVLRRAIASAIIGILTALTVAQALAQTQGIPVDPKRSMKPPEGAIVLFDGKPDHMRDNWYARRTTKPAAWAVDDKGVATPNKSDITSKQEFGDCYLHVEFCEPLKGGGNSGVGMQGRYEIQILNSYGNKPGGRRLRRVSTARRLRKRTPPSPPASGRLSTSSSVRPVSTTRASSWRRPVPPSTRTGRWSRRTRSSRGRPASSTGTSKARCRKDRSCSRATTTRAVPQRVGRAGGLLSRPWLVVDTGNVVGYNYCAYFDRNHCSIGTSLTATLFCLALRP